MKSEFKDDEDPEYKPNKPTLINISKKLKKKGIKKGPLVVERRPTEN